MNTYSPFLLIFLLLNCILTTFAKSYDYSSNMYEEEGRILIKSQIFYSHLLNKTPELPTKAASMKNVILAENLPLLSAGFGLNGAAALFFSDNFATELSIGFLGYKIQADALNNIHQNFKSQNFSLKDQTQDSNLYWFHLPINLALQFHVAPFGAFRPYIGLGYHYDFNLTLCDYVKFSNLHGVSVQIGADIVSKDDSILGLDLKWHPMNSSQVEYMPSLVGNSNTKAEFKLPSLIFGLTLGYNF